MSVSKVLFTILFVFIFWFFLFISTFSKTKEVVTFQNNNEIWYIDLSNKKLDDIKVNENIGYNLNNVDNVYFNISEKSDFTLNNNIFKLSKWLFLFNLYDLSTDYKIVWNWFTLKPISPWIFFMDLNDENNLKIFSIDSLLDMELLDLKDNSVSNQLKIYPNIWVKFNPKRNALVKNTDFLRTQLLVNFKYFPNKLFVNNKINIDWISKAYSYYDKESLDFLSSVFEYEYLSDQDFRDNAKILSSTTVSWLKYIEKYYTFFLNDNKKIIYLKNKIIDNLNSLYYSKSKFEELSQEFRQDFESLKILDSNEYEKFKSILDHYYKLSFVNKNIETKDLSLSYLEVLKIYNNKNTKLLKSSFYLNSIFSLSNSSKNNLNEQLYLYIDALFEENWIILKMEDRKITFNEKNLSNVYLLQNLAFYIKNIASNNLEIKTVWDFDNYIELFEYFYVINKSLDLVNKDVNIETNIVEFYDFYSWTVKNIRELFFKRELSDKWLLVLEKKDYSKKSLLELNNLMSNIFKYYKSNEEFLSDKNKIIWLSYQRVNKSFEQYYLAISNYNEYIITYDKTTSTLFWSDTIYSQQQEQVVSKENLLKYLKKFVWFDLENLEVKIIDENYYEISSIYINGIEFSFDIYPKRLNMLTNIRWAWLEKLKNSSYELDTLELEYEELAKNSDWDSKYDFSYFFINTFFSNNNWNIKVDFNNETQEIVEDKIITIFKRDRLFWSKWDFNILKPELTFNYRDVVVELKDNNYDINLKNWKYLANLNIENTSFSLEVIIDWKYNFEKHSFENLSIKLIDKEWSDDSNIQYLLWWKTIKIPWVIKTVDFKKEFEKILEALIYAKDSYQLLNNNLNSFDPDVELLSNNNVKFSFESDNKQIKIIFKEWNFIMFNVNWQDYVKNKEISSPNLIQYLPLINKENETN